MEPFDVSRRAVLGAVAVAGVSAGVGREVIYGRPARGQADAPQVGDGGLLEIDTGDEGTLFYELAVDGRVTKAFDRGANAAELRNDDVRELDSGLVSVVGETANGQGDAYVLSGPIVDFEYNDESAPPFEVRLAGRDVTNAVTALDTSDSNRSRDLLEIRTSGNGTLVYDLLVDGRVTKAFDRGPDSAERGNDDVDRFRDGTWGVLGETANGRGDTYYLYGPILEFEHVPDGAPPFGVFLNGEDVTVRLVGSGDGAGNGGNGGGGDGADGPDDGGSLAATIDVSCYYADVDATSYDEVVLRTSDGTTLRFTGNYEGDTRFGYAGSGQVDAGDESFDAFHGWIRRVTVSDGSARATRRNAGESCLDVTRGCSSVTMRRRAGVNVDVNVYFADGSIKAFDGAFQSPFVVGSPGRVFDRASFDSPHEVVVPAAEGSCDPGEYATTFDCTRVTVGAAEFTTVPPTFGMATLRFADGTEQRFGDQFGPDEFTAPRTFRGTGDNEGKVIERILLSADGGDVFFNLVNPGADDCAG